MSGKGGALIRDDERHIERSVGKDISRITVSDIRTVRASGKNTPTAHEAMKSTEKAVRNLFPKR